MLSTTNYADLQIICNHLRINGLERNVGAYTPRVAKGERQDEPIWRVRIRAAVKTRGALITLAKAAKMPSTQLQKIENGTTRNPGITTMARIAIAMGTTLPALLSADPRDGEISAEGNERREGSAVLQSVLEGGNATPLQRDVASAIQLLREALERDKHREATVSETSPAGRRTTPGH